jgi:hypothetical protein
MSQNTAIMLPAVLSPTEIQQVLQLLGRTQLQGNEAMQFVTLSQKLGYLAELTVKALEHRDGAAIEAAQAEANGAEPTATPDATPDATPVPPAATRPRPARRR